MRINKISASVLALCFVMLVSTASAYTIAIPGGTASGTANGGSSGANGLIVYEDGYIDGVHFDHVLSEEIWAQAYMAANQVGNANAAYSTNGEDKTATEQIGNYRTLSVTLNGDVEVDVSKTSKVGESYAYAEMYSAAGIDGAQGSDIGGESGLYAYIYGTGAGSAKASAIGNTSFEAANLAFNSYSFGYANGAVILEGDNSNFGGDFYGMADIFTQTFIAPSITRGAFGSSYQDEYLWLYADRGPSYYGDSYIEGSIIGSEGGETNFYGNSYVVDSEATSYGYGSAYASNPRDKAVAYTWLDTRAELINNGNGVDTTASVSTGAAASTDRKVQKSGSPTMAATATMDQGTWTTSATAGSNISYIAGELGIVPDGVPGGVPGMSATAWQFNRILTPINSSAVFTQTATTAGKPHISTYFDVCNNGPKYGTKGVKDATGAYGAVKNLFADVQLVNQNYELETYDAEYDEISAIEWIQGSDKVINHKHIDNTNVVNTNATRPNTRFSDWYFTATV